MFAWQQLSLLERIRRLRYIIPPALVLLVVVYQLGVARPLSLYSHTLHYAIEIVFYSLAGPVATWLTLIWVEHRLAEKETLEQQVRARERHLASLTDASADAILSLDRAGNIASWNRGAERLFGYGVNQIVGRPLARLVPDAATLLDHVQKEGVVQNFETTALAPNGRPIAVELTHTLLSDDPTENLTSSLIMRDVTTRRERATIVEEERVRIARDLHDSVAQILYLLALKADMAAGQVVQNPDQVKVELTEIGQRSRQVIREIRRTIFALRPLDWSSDGFLPALQRFAKDFAEQLNWRVSFNVDDNVSVPDRLQPTVFRLVQESLNNVAKHAEAEKVWIELRQLNDPLCLSLSIRDNGTGFEPTAESGSGLGLRQMQKRIEVVNGTFILNSRMGDGTTISAHIPV